MVRITDSYTMFLLNNLFNYFVPACICPLVQASCVRSHSPSCSLRSLTSACSISWFFSPQLGTTKRGLTAKAYHGGKTGRVVQLSIQQDSHSILPCLKIMVTVIIIPLFTIFSLLLNDMSYLCWLL